MSIWIVVVLGGWLFGLLWVWALCVVVGRAERPRPMREPVAPWPPEPREQRFVRGEVPPAAEVQDVEVRG